MHDVKEYDFELKQNEHACKCFVLFEELIEIAII